MLSRPTRLFATLLALATLPNLLPAADLLDGVPVEILARSTVKLADGTVTFLLIRPPVFPARPAPPPPAAIAAPTAEELAAEAVREAKPRVSPGVSATTYAGTPVVTEFSWQLSDGRRFRAFGNLDAAHVGHLAELESETTVYEYNWPVSDGDPAALPAGVREALSATPGIQYLFEGSEADAQANETVLQALDHLLAHFQLNEISLRAEAAARTAGALEAERQAALKAAQSKATTIFFWKNEPPTPSP